MPFNDYECKCGQRYEDEWATTASAVKRSISCKCGKTAATGTIELTWPMAVVAVAYIAGQTVVDTWGE